MRVQNNDGGETFVEETVAAISPEHEKKVLAEIATKTAAKDQYEKQQADLKAQSEAPKRMGRPPKVSPEN